MKKILLFPMLIFTTVLFSLFSIIDVSARPSIDALDLVQNILSQKNVSYNELQASGNKELSMWNYNLAVQYQAQGNYEMAYANIIKAVNLDPQNSHAWLLLGNILCDKGYTILGIKSLTVASILLESEGDTECYLLALALIEKFGG